MLKRNEERIEKSAAAESILILPSKAIESHVMAHGMKHLEEMELGKSSSREAYLKHGERVRRL